VCSHLTRKGTGSKGLVVTRNKVPGNAGHLFFTSLINIPTSIFFLNNAPKRRIIPKRQEWRLTKKDFKMKYFMAMIAAIALCFGFVACGDEKEDTADTAAVEESAADAADAGSDAGDGEAGAEGEGDAGSEEEAEEADSDAEGEE